MDIANFQALPPGSVVYISGRVEGSFVIDRPLKLVGRGAVFDGGGNGTVLRILSSNVQVFNITVENCGRVGLDSGIWVENARGVVISNVTVRECLYPIMIYNSSDVVVAGSKIASFSVVPVVAFTGRGGVVLHELTQYFRGHGVYVWYSWNVTVADSYFTRTLDGVYCDHAYGLFVVGNRFFNGSRYGVHLMYCNDVVVKNNTVVDYVVGFIPMYSNRISIVGNLISDIRRIGGAGIVVFESNDVVIRRNVVVRSYLALDFYRSPINPQSFVYVSDNVFAYNNIAVRLDPISAPVVWRNIFIENIRNVLPLFNNKALLYNASSKEGNYWGEPAYGQYVVTQRVFDSLLQDNPQLEIMYLTPAFSVLEFALGVKYPTGGELVDKYPQTPHVSIVPLLLFLIVVVLVLLYAWRRRP
ncbi:MAG: NosD domain-containing protein [Pyrobaculum sp.]